MKLGYLAILMTLFPLLSGVSGCDSRLKFAVYRYELTKCTPAGFSFPNETQYGEWEIKTDKPRIACPRFSHYLMTDEKFRSGGFGTPKASSFCASIEGEGTSCELLLAFSFDLIDPDPEKRFRVYADAAATALLQGNNATAKVPPKSFATLGGKDDYEKWCTQK